MASCAHCRVVREMNMGALRDAQADWDLQAKMREGKLYCHKCRRPPETLFVDRVASQGRRLAIMRISAERIDRYDEEG